MTMFYRVIFSNEYKIYIISTQVFDININSINHIKSYVMETRELKKKAFSDNDHLEKL